MSGSDESKTEQGIELPSEGLQSANVQGTLLGKLGVKELEAYLSEVLDSERVHISCGKHNYVPGRFQKPRSGCAMCVKALFLTQFAKCPPHRREQFMENLEAMVTGMVEAVHDGTFDIKLTPPEIKIEKS